MENRFYVGVVCHSKRPFKAESREKLVLYKEDDITYLDLLTGNSYTIDKCNRDYIEEGTLIPTDISQYRENYIYMLDRYKEDTNVRKKIFNK